MGAKITLFTSKKHMDRLLLKVTFSPPIKECTLPNMATVLSDQEKGRNQLKTGFGQKGLKSFWLTHRTPV